MSDPEKFLDRWSRRKREAADEIAPVEAKDAADAVAPMPEAKEKAKEPVAESAFDPASLPPIESITAESDIRAFLHTEVPPELSRAALRRAWSTDPAIRDFVGLVENGWDFNDPTAMHGFGPIDASEVAQLLARVIGAPLERTEPEQTAAAQDNSTQNPALAASESRPELPQDQPTPVQDSAAPERGVVQCNEANVALRSNSDDREGVPPSRRRGHGGALPK